MLLAFPTSVRGKRIPDQGDITALALHSHVLWLLLAVFWESETNVSRWLGRDELRYGTRVLGVVGPGFAPVVSW